PRCMATQARRLSGLRTALFFRMEKRTETLFFGAGDMKRPELAIHKEVVRHLRKRAAPGALWWHTPNGIRAGGRKASVQGAIAKGMGVRAGVADIIAVHRGMFFALELKAPGGRPTEAQLEFQSAFRNQGGFTCVAEGLDAAIGTLELWGLLRGRAA